VQVFTSNGEYLTKLQLSQIPNGATQVSVENRLRGVSVNNEGNLLVADKYFIRKYKVSLP
jgi:hypothetical protein